ncbi:MAG: hypothetical protein ACK4RK_18175 [Gemmataceae bacterium]
MSIWGKILAVLNVLAAILFFVLAYQDVVTRQKWSYAVFRHELLLHGLPLDARSQNFQQPSLVARNLSDETLEVVFDKLGPPVRTQQEEVTRKRDELLQHIRGLPDDAQQRRALKDALLPLARTGDERDALLERLGNTEVPTKELLADLEQRFDAVAQTLSITNNPQEPEGDDAARRQAVAHLLYNVDADDNWHKRLVAIIGLQAYATEANRQAIALEEMIVRLQTQLDNEQTDFIALYNALIQKRTRVLAAQVAALRPILAQREEVAKQHERIVQFREAEKADYQDTLAAAEKETKDALNIQTVLERQLFQAQLTLGTAFDRNIELERMIRHLELGR